MLYLNGSSYFIAGVIVATISIFAIAFFFVLFPKKRKVYLAAPTDRVVPIKNPVIPSSPEHFYKLLDLPVNDLRDMGFGIWDNMVNIVKDNKAFPSKVSDRLLEWSGPKDTVVVLFPVEWFHKIPIGFMCTGLYGQEFPFSPDTCSMQPRMGFLAYGIKKQLGE